MVNPNNCWNWWGYLNDYFGGTYATKYGVQMRGIYKMIRQIASLENLLQ